MKPNNKNKLPKNFSPKTLEITHIGSKGEGTSKLYTEFDYIEKEEIENVIEHLNNKILKQ